MAGRNKNLPWPQNLWKDLFLTPEQQTPPDDWKEALDKCKVGLTDLEKEILRGWYQDRLTATQLTEKLGLTRSVQYELSQIKARLRKAPESKYMRYGIQRYHAAEEAVNAMDIGLDNGEKRYLIVDILEKYDIQRINDLTMEIRGVYSEGEERRKDMMVVLSRYLLYLHSFKPYVRDNIRARDTRRIAGVLAEYKNKEAVIRRLEQSVDVGPKFDAALLLDAFYRNNVDNVVKACTGKTMFELLVDSGIVTAQEQSWLTHIVINEEVLGA